MSIIRLELAPDGTSPSHGFRPLARRVPRDQRGVAAMEFAVLAPVLVVLLLGLTEAVRVVRAKMELSTAVGVMAKLIAVQTGVTTFTGSTIPPPSPPGSLQDVCKGAQLMLQPSQQPKFAMNVASVTNAPATNTGPGVIVLDWEVDKACTLTASPFPATGTGSAISMATPLIPNVSDSAIVVRGSAAYTPAFANTPIPFSAMTLTFTAVVRPRYGTVPCQDQGKTKCTTSGE
jgi:Flp pilus assembly pilin Flp